MNAIHSPVLLGDIGGTHTRLALSIPGEGMPPPFVVENARHSGVAAILAAFLAERCRGRTPHTAAFAVAGPVSGESVTLTNLGWRLEAAELRGQFRFEAVHLINDMCAAALAVPSLGPADRVQIGTGRSVPDGNIGVLGPGTGLGVSGLVKSGPGWIPIAGEGGHVTLPSRDRRERGMVEGLEQEFGHVSAERALSGPGIENLYRLVAGGPGAAMQPAPAAPEISRRAISGEDLHAVEALDAFFALLGTVAGDLALSLGATGGIFLAGGILPELRAQLNASRFRQRFVDKGRYRSYLEAIPTFLMTCDSPTLRGLRYFVDRQR
ncbi:MAG: glucokinase [Gammaproteobacteria bacterium]|nr:glucokinase [Gammaproteobacteria bacterium]